MSDVSRRLESPDPGVRRVAIHDLIANPAATDILLRHLESESDEKAALLIIRHVARAGVRGALPRLLGLYQNPATPVRIAHAAIRAHDAMGP